MNFVRDASKLLVNRQFRWHPVFCAYRMPTSVAVSAQHHEYDHDGSEWACERHARLQWK
jgi:hypothetical protein